MLYELGKYGGFITIALAWVTLVLPFVLLKKNKKWKYLSEAAIRGFWGSVLKIGVVTCGIFQILFAYFLYQSFRDDFSRIGIVIYGLASVSFLFCGLITYYQKRSVHRFFLKSYYILMSAGFLFISIKLNLITKILAILLIILPVYFSLIRKQKTAFEIITIILSNLVALCFYQNLGIINLV